MKKQVEFAFKKQIYSELALEQRKQSHLRFEEQFNVVLETSTLVLPLKPKIAKFTWITQSINHEYLHIIVSEVESISVGYLLDNLGYNLATGYRFSSKPLSPFLSK
jgi:hypothetical protein